MFRRLLPELESYVWQHILAPVDSARHNARAILTTVVALSVRSCPEHLDSLVKTTAQLEWNDKAKFVALVPLAKIAGVSKIFDVCPGILRNVLEVMRTDLTVSSVCFEAYETMMRSAWQKSSCNTEEWADTFLEPLLAASANSDGIGRLCKRAMEMDDDVMDCFLRRVDTTGGGSEETLGRLRVGLLALKIRRAKKNDWKGYLGTNCFLRARKSYDDEVVACRFFR